MLARPQVSRVSVSVPSTLLARFDDYVTRLGYTNRSKAIQDAMQNLITESKWICEQRGVGVGAVAIVYDQGVKALEAELAVIQHRFRATICSALHVDLDARRSLRILAVRGRAAAVRDLTQTLKTQKGVRQLKLAVVTP